LFGQKFTFNKADLIYFCLTGKDRSFRSIYCLKIESEMILRIFRVKE